MSLDPFEARLAFAKLVRTLNASQQSIQKAVSFAVKYGARCGEDLWDCVVDEMAKASLNSRLNILYFLDGLAETSAQLGAPDAPYLEYMGRSLSALVAAAVPETREGVLNARSTRLILESWRARRVLPAETVDAALAELAERQRRVRESTTNRATATTTGESASAMPRADILRRIEEDRERQKRLRERIWILPVPPLRGAGGTTAATQAQGTMASPASTSMPTPDSPRRAAAQANPATPAGAGARSKLMPPPPPPAPPAPAPLDVEFDQLWDAEGDLDDDNVERMRE